MHYRSWTVLRLNVTLDAQLAALGCVHRRHSVQVGEDLVCNTHNLHNAICSVLFCTHASLFYSIFRNVWTRPLSHVLTMCDSHTELKHRVIHIEIHLLLIHLLTMCDSN